MCLELDPQDAGEALSGILDWGSAVWVVADACDVLVRRGEAPVWRPDVYGYTDGHTITIVAGDVRWVTRHEWGHVLGYADGEGWMDPRVFEYEEEAW